MKRVTKSQKTFTREALVTAVIRPRKRQNIPQLFRLIYGADQHTLA